MKHPQDRIHQKMFHLKCDQTKVKNNPTSKPVFFEDLTTSDQKHDPQRERKDILYMTQVKRST